MPTTHVPAPAGGVADATAAPTASATNDAMDATAATSATATCPDGALTVLFDGACPLCRREIALYQGLTARQPLAFVDVSSATADLPPGTDRATLLARFHVRRADGSLVSGARGFAALWAVLPGWRWLARIAALPGVTPLLEVLYRVFLRLRPALQRVAASFEPPAMAVPASLRADLRSDHAGETGAVWIYRGVLAVARDPAVRDFARRHLATEQEHLRLVTALLPWPQRSRLLVPWRVAGFLTGALPALAGPRAVFATIAAVETFVDRHYQQQIDQLDALPPARRSASAPLRALLAQCQADECAHRDEAAALAAPRAGPLLRAWCAAVGRGSAVAVAVARRL
ncbi:demethoxyubiquinone hydroxylase family protein [Rubrivivax sp. RP6-9]|uniref:demethoxyubiquinone hydroxylase family protein n=1 Tax=Rubrivivax sp. RP6-9 TaxID=3415750 RepID=UPI003CC623F1